MNNNFAVLNKVQQHIVNFANANNINLSNEFASVEEFKKFVVGLTIKTLVEGGLDVSKAYDIAFGDGAYDKMAEQVWNMSQQTA